MHDGREIAVKVQRPGALRQCLLDASVIIVALQAIKGRFWNGDLLAIFDLVGGVRVKVFLLVKYLSLPSTLCVDRVN